jgi:hypothetical protein
VTAGLTASEPSIAEIAASIGGERETDEPCVLLSPCLSLYVSVLIFSVRLPVAQPDFDIVPTMNVSSVGGGSGGVQMPGADDVRIDMAARGV